MACGCILTGSFGSQLYKGRPNLFQLYTSPLVRCVFNSAVTARKLLPRGGAPPERLEPPHATHRGAYPQFGCVCPKRWQRLHCKGPFGATYVSNDTHRPQSSLIDRTLDTSGPRATETMKWGMEGLSLVRSWSRRPRTPLRDTLDMNAQGLQLLPDDAFRHSPALILHQKSCKAVLMEREGLEKHTLPPSRDHSALTAALKLKAVDGTTISFSALSLAVRPPGQYDRNQLRKARMSRRTEIQMGALLGRSSSAKQVLITWALVVVPFGLSLREEPDISLDLRLLNLSDETADSNGSEFMALGLGGPLDDNGATDPARAAVYVTHPSGDMFARDYRCTLGQRRGPIARCRVTVCGLQCPARGCQLVGFTLARGLGR